MPRDTIARTFVDNGPNESYTNELRLAWGARGDAPEAPDGWVNAGYAHLEVARLVLDEDSPGSRRRLSLNYVVLNAAEMDHLIRKLKKIRKKAFDAPDPSSERG